MTPRRLPRTAAILGGGAMGETLLSALRAARIRVSLAWNRSPKPPPWRTSLEGIGEADIVLLAVSDAAVGPLCARLARERRIRRGQLVVHLAGTLTLDALEPARAAYARVGSLHPLRALHRDAPPILRGAFAGIAASDETARKRLRALAVALGLRPIDVAGERPLYHAAAVLAAGGLVALFGEAVRAFRAATGADEPAARAALLPLAEGALRALRELPAPAALTGPVVRGDAATVRAHRAALASAAPGAALLYDAVTRAAVSLSREARTTPPPKALAGISALLGTRASRRRRQRRRGRARVPGRGRGGRSRPASQQ